MNCKQGDLAVRVRGSGSIPIGAVVRCVRFIGKAGVFNSRTGRLCEVVDTWDVEFRGHVVDPVDGKTWALSDSELLPIRDSRGDDETLTWAGKPQEVTA